MIEEHHADCKGIGPACCNGPGCPWCGADVIFCMDAPCEGRRRACGNCETMDAIKKFDVRTRLWLCPDCWKTSTASLPAPAPGLATFDLSRATYDTPASITP